MKTKRQILLEKARAFRENADAEDELKYANRKDELKRLRQARKDEKIIAEMRASLKKGGAK
jgi:hypothetical protein